MLRVYKPDTESALPAARFHAAQIASGAQTSRKFRLGKKTAPFVEQKFVPAALGQTKLPERCRKSEVVVKGSAGSAGFD